MHFLAANKTAGNADVTGGQLRHPRLTTLEVFPDGFGKVR
jgi:hypothetical protein